ncbi:uncharacterized protein LOC131023178 [Salvia miltiorrhiza]|uniref:uncharacterized protein LOC131023178 n=1 Tax=Salvia miltiorrhiza TaxID=226208 RepID=UPI0025ACF397|nr:uncharacterized protein LOC131023178 [Salvia miltiorrhiza]
MIIDEENGPISNRARKQNIRSCKVGIMPSQVMSVRSVAREPSSSFGPEDHAGLVHPHDDALVLSVDVAYCTVHRIFVDLGSALNIIYKDRLIAMALDATLKLLGNLLYDFTGESILPLGSLELPMTWGKEWASRTRILKILVVDFPKPSYNIIIGRPALNAFQAVISMYHLKMKFSLENDRVGGVIGSQITSKEWCFVKSLTAPVGSKRTQSWQGGPAEKIARAGGSSGNTAKQAEIEEIGRFPEKQPMISTDDRCMLMELFPGKTGFTTRVGTEMSPSLKKKMIECLRRNADVFAFTTVDLKGIDRTLAEHRLNVDPAKKPVIQKIRHFGPKNDAAIREQVKALLQAGHIVEVLYPVWLSNAVMVEKKEKEWRMCVDYRDLNAACPKDCYPLPRIDHLVDSTAVCELLSMMDAFQGYHQISMHPEDIAKIAFTVCCGVFGFARKPFGLKNARVTYQRMMDTIFQNQIGRIMSVYVNDMMVQSRAATSHPSDLEEVFKVIPQNRLMLNPKKCTFGVRTGKFLGYRVTP